MRKKNRKTKKKYKIMKGGSLAGNFFRFLASENEKDNVNIENLKKIDEYKREKKRKEEEERKNRLRENERYLLQKQDEERIAYMKTHEIVDGSQKLKENSNLNVLKGGGELLDRVNKEQNDNFNKWFEGSTQALNQLLENKGLENEPPTAWQREEADGLFFHVKKYNGGQRRKRKTRRKTKKKSRKLNIRKKNKKRRKKKTKKKRRKSF